MINEVEQVPIDSIVPQWVLVNQVLANIWAQ